MAKQLFRFGDQETADIKLQVISDDGGEESNVYVHSQVLKKSEFYEVWLSRRWSLDEPLRELKIRVSASSEIYLKCFHLIYSCEADERFCFSSVDEALDILSVASQMLFLEAIKQCMEYLDAVRWSSEQEAKIRDMLSSLQIKILPELATRIGMDLNKSDRGHLDTVKEILQDMLSTSGSNNGLPRTGVEQYIVGYFEAANRASAKAVAEHAGLYCSTNFVPSLNVSDSMSLVNWEIRLIVLGLPYCGSLTLLGAVMGGSIKR